MEKDFSAFEKKIGITFSDKVLLRNAFVHRSYMNENSGDGLEHNERLEFLGDAVLELVITDHLFNEYPDKPEGELTAIRAAVVNTVTLSEAAGALGVEGLLFLSKGEARGIDRSRQYLLANAFEAIVGAIYTDQGYDKAREFILSQLSERIPGIVQDELWRDSKSSFQEMAQRHTGITPTYKIEESTGPDHDKHFVIGVYLKKEKVAEGEGKSKQEAEQNAAREALKVRGW